MKKRNTKTVICWYCKKEIWVKLNQPDGYWICIECAKDGERFWVEKVPLQTEIPFTGHLTD